MTIVELVVWQDALGNILKTKLYLKKTQWQAVAPGEKMQLKTKHSPRSDSTLTQLKNVETL